MTFFVIGRVSFTFGVEEADQERRDPLFVCEIVFGFREPLPVKIASLPHTPLQRILNVGAFHLANTQFLVVSSLPDTLHSVVSTHLSLDTV